MYTQGSSRSLKPIATGTLTGGFAGTAAGLIYSADIITIPGMGDSLTAVIGRGIIAGAVPGILLGAGIGSLIVLYRTQHRNTAHNPDLNHSVLKLHEEQLDISKRQVLTGEVTVRKEVRQENKTIVVPVSHEELVIEKKVMPKDAPGKKGGQTQTLRIPIGEERIEVIRHPVNRKNVAVYKQQQQKTEHIEAVLKKEKVKIKTTGDPNISDRDD
jgi:uncharacterized protein (TIGR02271 family)